MKKQKKTRLAVLTAMFAALIIVTTAYLKIPAPLGYAHLGDSMIYLSASILPAPFGFLAAGIGGALADLLAGYPQWAIPTAVIKMFNVLPFFIVGLVMKGSPKLGRIVNPPYLLMLIPSTIVTLGGYFAANTLMYDIGAATAELLPNLFQSIVGAIVYIILGLSLDSVKFKSRLTGK